MSADIDDLNPVEAKALAVIRWAVDWLESRKVGHAPIAIRNARDLACVDALRQGASIEQIADALGVGVTAAWDRYWAGHRTLEPDGGR